MHVDRDNLQKQHQGFWGIYGSAAGLPSSVLKIFGNEYDECFPAVSVPPQECLCEKGCIRHAGISVEPKPACCSFQTACEGGFIVWCLVQRGTHFIGLAWKIRIWILFFRRNADIERSNQAAQREFPQYVILSWWLLLFLQRKCTRRFVDHFGRLVHGLVEALLGLRVDYFELTLSLHRGFEQFGLRCALRRCKPYVMKHKIFIHAAMLLCSDAVVGSFSFRIRIWCINVIMQKKLPPRKARQFSAYADNQPASHRASRNMTE
jgi:hypothetical protein